MFVACELIPSVGGIFAVVALGVFLAHKLIPTVGGMFAVVEVCL